MTRAELFALHSATVAELEAARALVDGSRSLEARKAAREVDRLEQKLAKLDEKRERHPSLRGHGPTCWCGGCGHIGAGKISESEPLRMYGINVPESLHGALKALGSARVRAALEELARAAHDD